MQGAHVGAAEPPESDVHGDSHVRGPDSGVGALVHPQLTCGNRSQVFKKTFKKPLPLFHAFRFRKQLHPEFWGLLKFWSYIWILFASCLFWNSR